jgi:c-di-GMP-binding flagellar brake protein YcgR
MPMHKSVPVILLPGTKIRGRVVASSVSWEFTSTFIEKRMIPLPLWIIKMPDELTKIQLRSYVRLQASVSVLMSVVSEDGESPPVKVISRDISGGGVQLAVKEHLDIGSALKLSLDIGDPENPVAQGKIIRVDKLPDINIYWVAVKFTEITERNREKIIKYIFRKQTERRQKELT